MFLQIPLVLVHLLLLQSHFQITAANKFLPDYKQAIRRALKHRQVTAPGNTTTTDDVSTIAQRRVSELVGTATSLSSVPKWLSALNPNGTWSDVDYTTGCDAQQGNWPAESHWNRIIPMVAAWHGGVKKSAYVKDPTIRAAISSAMGYWFSNDFSNPACLDQGGKDTCPCGTPGFWNQNWFDQVIAIPQLVAQTCLVLNDTLTPSELGNCTLVASRAYGTFVTGVEGISGFLTGANTLDVAVVGIDNALLTHNATLLTDAYGRVHSEVAIVDKVKSDGIRPDGSFGQHSGMLYNGNYGKDYLGDILDLETIAGGTQFAAGQASQDAVATLVDGNRWMTYQNVLTGVLHWDVSVIGRMITFPTADNQATANLKYNITELKVLGDAWNSATISSAATEQLKNWTTANSGGILGNRMFFANDYMVHRGANYVTTLKMFSNRTHNTECTNSQNPLGFHLSDGALYTYLNGNEYEDNSAVWDWNIIPGTTTDYNATVLECAHAGFGGIESFVGGVSTGNVGAAAMRYTNPYTKSLKWQKAWFFLDDDIQHVMVSGLNSSTDAPVFSVLDQRLHNGTVQVDGNAVDPAVKELNGTVTSLWHANVGYVFADLEDCDYSSSDGQTNVEEGRPTLSLKTGIKTGNWNAIGTSTQPTASVDMFTALLDHSDTVPISYTVLPGVDFQTFQTKSSELVVETLQNNEDVSAIYDLSHDTFYGIFWSAQGGSASWAPADDGSEITITSSGNAAIIYNPTTGTITASDPSQTLTDLTVTISCADFSNITLSFVMPSGGLAGSSLSHTLT